jgi:DNA-directed RNA polymerase specialized sigma24 family protein
VDKFQTQDFAQFFLLTHFDEMKAVDHATESLALFNKLKKNNRLSKKLDQNFVQTTHKIWKKYPYRSVISTIKASQITISPELLKRADGETLTFWANCLSHLRSEEYLALLWHEVFHISVSDLAEALDVTTGTVRFRLQKAYVRVGQLIRRNGAQ